ncbi:spondin domain-containing protein [Anabaena cylindrica UHCC 0172]|uniref:spondin domain-containing protein n=1 Tax=Anabaena cylindrica TaxID=1165 RepID=UPI002B1EC909|nr:spondin domain-containing protein [Anabaena cylindrica]MEA5552563.1 spondin domain-containing protein [Anabaena cylindrica UHCC 0172]
MSVTKLNVVVTPLWVGFHDGNFDIFNLNESASSSLERLAEDGDTAPISNLFSSSGNGQVQGTFNFITQAKRNFNISLFN